MQTSPLIRIALSLFSFFMMPLSLAQTPVSLVQGVVDLSHWNAAQNPLLKLDGEARFYWNAFQVSDPRPEVQPEFIRLSGSWHRNSTHPLYGFATYELEFISDREQALALDLGTVAIAHRIYADGQLLDAGGDPQADRKSYQIGPARQSVVTLILPKGRLRVSIEVSNFEYMISGLVKPVVIGTPLAVLSHRYAGLAPAFVLFGAYLAMALYHFGLYTLRRRDQGSFYFGLFCLAMLPSTVINMQMNALELYAEVSLALGIYLASSFGIASGFLGLFIAYLFDSPWSRRISFVLLGFCLFLAVVQAFDLQLYVMLMGVKFSIGLVLAAFLTRTVYRAVRTRQQSSMMMLVSCGLLICTAVNDFANFNNWINSTPLFSFGSLAFLMIQSYLLSVRFSNAFKEVEKSAEEIRKLSEEIKAQHDHVVAINENLEHLAEEKTRDIRSIMSHIQLGIFAITSEAYAVHKDHSQHLRDILELDDVTGMNACRLLFDRSDLSADAISQAVSCWEVALGEKDLVFDMNAHCLPVELRYTAPSGRQKFLELSWNAIANDEGMTEKILVTLKDVTTMRALAEEAQDKKEELEFISELLNVPTEAFRRFLQDAQDFLAENRKLVNSQSIQARDLEVLKVLFINMHTMKGASRSLYLKKMTNVFHEVEQYYAHLQKNPQAHWDVKKMNDDLDETQKMISIYVNVYQNKLYRKVGGERDIEVSEAKMMQLYEGFKVANRVVPAPDALPFMRDMGQFFRQALFRPAQDVLLDIGKGLGALAKDLNKEKPLLRIEASDLLLTHAGEILLRRVFVHLLRNTMDHGIETASERIAKGKPAAGTISVMLSEDAMGMTLRYQDDGRGLNLEKIRALAAERNAVPHAERLTQEEVGELIFCPGLSTASEVSDISGRGVGMSAVRSYLQNWGGSITVHLTGQEHLEPGFCSFQFDIKLPQSLFAGAEKPDSAVAA